MKKYLALLLSVLLLGSLVGTTVFAQPNIDTNFYIDSKLPVKDRIALGEIMRALDPEDRKNVIFIFEDGSFTANRLELLEEFRKQNQDNFDKNGKIKLFKSPDVTKVKNKVTIAAYQNPSTEGTGGSGPYRRVLSKTGYSRLTANIYLPDKYLNEAYMKPGLPIPDKGYIYTGAVTTGGQIDMGLALNYDYGTTSTMETWGMFIVGDNGDNDANFGNFKMGTTVFLKYYTPSDNTAALYVSGVAKDGSPLAITLTAQIPSYKGFKVNGTGMQIKRITSIGQDTEDLTTGSYIKNVHWSNVKIGTTSESFVGYKTSNVLVDYFSQSDEKVWVKAGTLP